MQWQGIVQILTMIDGLRMNNPILMASEGLCHKQSHPN